MYWLFLTSTILDKNPWDTVADPGDQNSSGKSFFSKKPPPPHPYLRVWMTTPPPLISHVWIRHWDSTVIFIFLSFLGFSLKTVHLFRNFPAVLPPPALYKVETRNNFWIHESNIVCAVRGGVGPVWIGKRPRNAKVSEDFCPWLKVCNTNRHDEVMRPNDDGIFFHSWTGPTSHYSSLSKLMYKKKR